MNEHVQRPSETSSCLNDDALVEISLSQAMTLKLLRN